MSTAAILFVAAGTAQPRALFTDTFDRYAQRHCLDWMEAEPGEYGHRRHTQGRGA
jgi:hypothetical protein